MKIAKLLGGAVLFTAFALLENSPAADIFRIKLIFREVTIPLYQWLMASIYIVFLRYGLKEPWKKAVAQVFILGLVLHLYPTMLDAQKEAWLGARLSSIYVLYVNAVVALATLSLAFLGVYAVTDAIDAVFFPMLAASVYGICFYYVYGHAREAAFFIIAFGVFIYLVSNRNILAKTGRMGKAALLLFSNKRRIVALIFIFALVVRLVFLFNLLHIEGARYPYASDDGTSYDAYAMRGLSDPLFYLRESPHTYLLFYSVPIAVIYKIFGHSYLAVGIIQSIVGAFMCCLVFILADRITGSITASILASAGAAIDSELIFLTTTMNTEALYIPLLVLVILFLLFYSESRNGSKAALSLALAAFFLGLATIIRVLGIILIGLILPWMIILGRGYLGESFSKRIRDGVIFTVLTFLTVSPITITNYINTRKPSLVYATGSDLWAVGSSAWGEEMVPSNKKLIALGMTDPVRDFPGSVKAVCARPKEILKAYGEIIPKRMRNLFLWPNFGTFDPIYLMNASQWPNRYASNLEFYNLLLFFTSFFIFIFSKIKAHLKTLALLVICFYTIFHGIFFLSIGPRYGAPMRPFLCIVISYSLYRIFEFIRLQLWSEKR